MINLQTIACFLIYPIPMSERKRIRQAPFNPPYPRCTPGFNTYPTDRPYPYAYSTESTL